MKGAAGERRNGFSVTELHGEGASGQPGRQRPGLLLVQHHHRPGLLSSPVSSKSRPVARAASSTAASAAVNERGVPSGAGPVPSAVKVPSMPHQAAERKRMRARSRSTTIRVATLWTRPADSRGMTFFHRTGETS